MFKKYERVVLNELINYNIKDEELEKVQNKYEANFIYSLINMQNIALSASFFELIDKLDYINILPELYRKISKEEIQKEAKKQFVKNNCSTLYYYREI